MPLVPKNAGAGAAALAALARTIAAQQQQQPAQFVPKTYDSGSPPINLGPPVVSRQPANQASEFAPGHIAAANTYRAGLVPQFIPKTYDSGSPTINLGPSMVYRQPVNQASEFAPGHIEAANTYRAGLAQTGGYPTIRGEERAPKRYDEARQLEATPEYQTTLLNLGGFTGNLEIDASRHAAAMRETRQVYPKPIPQPRPAAAPVPRTEERNASRYYGPGDAVPRVVPETLGGTAIARDEGELIPGEQLPRTDERNVSAFYGQGTADTRVRDDGSYGPELGRPEYEMADHRSSLATYDEERKRILDDQIRALRPLVRANQGGAPAAAQLAALVAERNKIAEQLGIGSDQPFRDFLEEELGISPNTVDVTVNTLKDLAGASVDQLEELGSDFIEPYRDAWNDPSVINIAKALVAPAIFTIHQLGEALPLLDEPRQGFVAVIGRAAFIWAFTGERFIESLPDFPGKDSLQQILELSSLDEQIVDWYQNGYTSPDGQEFTGGRAVWEGLVGHFTDDEPWYIKYPVRITADIAADPLTYLFAVAKVGKIVGTVGRGLQKADDIPDIVRGIGGILERGGGALERGAVILDEAPVAAIRSTARRLGLKRSHLFQESASSLESEAMRSVDSATQRATRAAARVGSVSDETIPPGSTGAASPTTDPVKPDQPPLAGAVPPEQIDVPENVTISRVPETPGAVSVADTKTGQILGDVNVRGVADEYPSISSAIVRSADTPIARNFSSSQSFTAPHVDGTRVQDIAAAIGARAVATGDSVTARKIESFLSGYESDLKGAFGDEPAFLSWSEGGERIEIPARATDGHGVGMPMTAQERGMLSAAGGPNPVAARNSLFKSGIEKVYDLWGEAVYGSKNWFEHFDTPMPGRANPLFRTADDANWLDERFMWLADEFVRTDDVNRARRIAQVLNAPRTSYIGEAAGKPYLKAIPPGVVAREGAELPLRNELYGLLKQSREAYQTANARGRVAAAAEQISGGLKAESKQAAKDIQRAVEVENTLKLRAARKADEPISPARKQANSRAFVAAKTVKLVDGDDRSALDNALEALYGKRSIRELTDDELADFRGRIDVKNGRFTLERIQWKRDPSNPAWKRGSQMELRRHSDGTVHVWNRPGNKATWEDAGVLGSADNRLLDAQSIKTPREYMVNLLAKGDNFDPATGSVNPWARRVEPGENWDTPSVKEHGEAFDAGPASPENRQFLGATETPDRTPDQFSQLDLEAQRGGTDEPVGFLTTQYDFEGKEIPLFEDTGTGEYPRPITRETASYVYQEEPLLGPEITIFPNNGEQPKHIRFRVENGEIIGDGRTTLQGKFSSDAEARHAVIRMVADNYEKYKQVGPGSPGKTVIRKRAARAIDNLTDPSVGFVDPLTRASARLSGFMRRVNDAATRTSEIPLVPDIRNEDLRWWVELGELPAEDARLLDQTINWKPPGKKVPGKDEWTVKEALDWIDLHRTVNPDFDYDHAKAVIASLAEGLPPPVRATAKKGAAKIAAKSGRAFDGYMNVVQRQHRRYGPLTGIRNVIGDTVGTAYQLMVRAEFGAALDTLNPQEAFRAVRALRKVDPVLGYAPRSPQRVAQSMDNAFTRGTGQLVPVKLMPGTSRGEDIFGGLPSLNRAVAHRNRVVRGTANIWTVPLFKDLLNTVDIVSRTSSWERHYEKLVKDSMRPFAKLIRNTAGDDLTAAEWTRAIEARARQIAAKEYAGSFSPEDVRIALKGLTSQNNDLARAWQRELNQASDQALERTQGSLFTYRNLNVDEYARRVFVFHYWQSRAVPLHVRSALRNPFLLNGYYKMWGEFQEIAKEGNYPPYLDLMFRFMQTPHGLSAFFNMPGTFLPTTIMDLHNERGQRAAVLVNQMAPPIAAALAVLGITDNTPDILATFGMEQFIRRFGNFALGEGVNPKDIPVIGDWFDESMNVTTPGYEITSTLIGSANSLLRKFGIEVGEFEPFDRGASEIDQMRSWVQYEAGLMFGPRYNDQGEQLWTEEQVQMYVDALIAVQGGDPNNPLVVAARQRYGREEGLTAGLSLVMPAGAVVTSQSRTDTMRLSTEFRDQGFEGTGEQRAASDYRAEALATDPTWVIANTEYHNLGDDTTDANLRLYNQLIYDPESFAEHSYLVQWMDAPTVEESGIDVSPLLDMTIDERREWVDAMFNRSGELGGIQKLQADRDAFKKANPEYTEYLTYQKGVYSYEDKPGGIRKWREDLAEDNPNFERAMNERRDWLEEQGYSGRALEAELDDWATKQDAYFAAMGEQSSIHDEKPLDVYDPSGDPLANPNMAFMLPEDNEYQAPKKDEPAPGSYEESNETFRQQKANFEFENRAAELLYGDEWDFAAVDASGKPGEGWVNKDHPNTDYYPSLGGAGSTTAQKRYEEWVRVMQARYPEKGYRAYDRDGNVDERTRDAWLDWEAGIIEDMEAAGYPAPSIWQEYLDDEDQNAA